MARDYYSVLIRAASALDPNTTEARRALYDIARRSVADANLSSKEEADERLTLEAAITQVESDARNVGPPALLHKPRGVSPRLIVSMLALLALLTVGIVGYVYWPKAGGVGGGDVPSDARMPAAEIPRVTSRGTPDESQVSYILRRQLVYYRTIHPVGTIVIAKSQRFLYLTRPNAVALRYTIRVGRECARIAGLLLVSAKENWGEQKAQLRKIESQSPNMQSTDSDAASRFGPRSLALAETGHRIHGNGEALANSTAGCFPLGNDDVVDLYDRVSVGTRVVVN